MRVKKFVPIKKGDIQEWRYITYVNPTPMSLLVNLVSSNDGNDIGVGLTCGTPPFLCLHFYLDQIFLPSLVQLYHHLLSDVLCIPTVKNGSKGY